MNSILGRKLKLSQITKTGFCILLTIFIFTLGIRNVLAQSKVESPNYNIQFPNLNSGAGIPTSTNYTVNSTLGQIASGLFESTNYTVRSGFQYIQTIIPFSFSVSDISIDLTPTAPQTPKTEQSTLTVKAGGAGGYIVNASENHPLAIDNLATNATIPDTLCDSGPCSQTTAQPWTLTTTYGFGLNMQGDDVPVDFSSGKYRQFSDSNSLEAPATIMTKSAVTWDYPNNTWPWESTATITYKLNISPIQAAGTYQNIITYTAVPSF